MFSANDIFKLLQYTQVNPSVGVENIFTTVVTQTGTFALTINNKNMLWNVLSSTGRIKLDELLEK